MNESLGVLLVEEDKALHRELLRHNMPVTVGEPAVPYGRTLIVHPGVGVPMGLVKAGMQFIETWDAAAPLWRYGVLAQDLGGREERERTQQYTIDLRVPVYACELLFVQQSSAGQALVDTWRAECVGGGDRRLAFLRALCQVKPRFLALPRSWLKELPLTAERARVQAQAREPRRPRKSMARLVQVQIAPGRSVMCRPGEEEQIKQLWAERLKARR